MPVNVVVSGAGEMVRQFDIREVVVGVDLQFENWVDEWTGIEEVSNAIRGKSDVIFPKSQMLLIGGMGS